MKTDDYENLREEIMYSRNIQDQFTIFLYTTVATIIGFAIQLQNLYLFLLPLMITLPVSIKIADYRRTISNLAAYMIVFLESEGTYQWETDNYNIEKTNKNNIKNKLSRNKFEALIHSLENFDSFFISLFCSIFFVYNRVIVNIPDMSFLWKDVVFSVISIIICVIIFVVCCQRPAILSSRSERILSVRDKVKCQGRKKETDTTGRKCQFQKKRAEAPGKNPRGAQVASQRSPILRRGQKPVN